MAGQGSLHPQAVLFDCDGVLVDSEPITIRLLRDDLAAHGLGLTVDQIMSIFVGGTIEGGADKARRLGARLPNDWVDRFYQRMYAALRVEVEPIPGVADLLLRLTRAGVKIAVGSNGPRAKMEITLGRAGLMDLLAPHVHSAQDHPRPKPAPDVYLHAASQLHVAANDCVVIEDSGSGAQAAVAAGMVCIGFATEGQDAQLAPYCDVIVGDMDALARHLGV